MKRTFKINTNWLPHKFYKHLSNDNKVQFWIVSTGCFVTIITFWFGIALQYINVDYNRSQNERLGHMVLIDKLYPIYKEYNDSCRALYEDDLKQIKKDKEKGIVSTLWQQKYKKILEAAKKSVELSSKAQYYFDKSTHDSIKHNNGRILLSLKAIDLYKYNLSEFAFNDSIWSYFRSNVFGFHILNTYGFSFEVNAMNLLSKTMVPKLKRMSDKQKEFSESKYALSVFFEEIAPHLRLNAEKMSEELVHASYHESISPIRYVMFSLLIVIFIGTLIWLILINVVFDKKKSFISDSDRKEFAKLQFEEMQIIKRINSLKVELKSLDSKLLENYNDFEQMSNKHAENKREIEIMNKRINYMNYG